MSYLERDSIYLNYRFCFAYDKSTSSCIHVVGTLPWKRDQNITKKSQVGEKTINKTYLSRCLFVP